MSRVARGEVWWYEHPDAKRRPYLVLTRSEAIGVLNQILAAPITGVVREIPTEVTLDRSAGMPSHCVITLDNVNLIRPTLCTERITTLPPDKMAAVCEELRVATAC